MLRNAIIKDNQKINILGSFLGSEDMSIEMYDPLGYFFYRLKFSSW